MNSSSFETHYRERQAAVVEFVTQAVRNLATPMAPAVHHLMESVEYSLLQGGKRFRPVLSLLLAEAFGVGPQRILPWATAIEMVHTYSLIHDDLPCMDNDDLRRGQPTNHIKFGESIALLAGDALLTEAFRQVAVGYEAEPGKAIQLIRILSEAAGIQGMVGGQAIDLESKAGKLSLADLKLMHSLKTGALIRATCEGTALVLGLDAEAQTKCLQFGAALGLCFQLKDDLLDSQEKIEKGSFPEVLGLGETQKYLEEVSADAAEILKALSIQQGPLHELLKMNSQRII